MQFNTFRRDSTTYLSKAVYVDFALRFKRKRDVPSLMYLGFYASDFQKSSNSPSSPKKSWEKGRQARPIGSAISNYNA